jgi:hypothetical protein
MWHLGVVRHVGRNTTGVVHSAALLLEVRVIGRGHDGGADAVAAAGCLCEQARNRSKETHSGQEDDDSDDKDGHQKEDQEPKAATATLSYDDHLWRLRWSCLAHSGFLGMC